MAFHCDLDLELAYGCVIGSAHHLIKVNICPKFNENPSRGKGDMKRT